MAITLSRKRAPKLQTYAKSSGMSLFEVNGWMESVLYIG
ncbi:hypothetical protein EMIT0P265_20581 [Pseudomonas zeae]